MKQTGYNSVTSWIALAACSVISLFCALLMRLAGLFFVIILDHYNTNRTNAAIPIALFGMLRCMTGPLTGFLGETVGYQAICMTGCIFSAVGVGACFFADNITEVIICLGVINGMGLAFGNTLIPQILRFHFDRNINLITGIYSSATSVGVMIMSPVIEYLKDVYGTPGMFLILSGIFLNCIPAAILLKHPYNKNSKLKAGKDYPQKSIHMEDTSSNEHCLKGKTNPTFVPDEELPHGGKMKYKDIELGKKNREKFKLDDKNSKVSTTLSKELVQKDNIFEDSEYFHSIVKNVNEQQNLSNSTNVALIEYTNKWLSDVSENYSKSQNEVINIERNIIRESSKLIKKSFSHRFLIFSDPTFYCIMTFESLHTFAATLNWTVLVDFARDKDIPDEKSIYFVMFMPIANVCGCLGFTWINDRGYMTRINYNCFCFTILTFDAALIAWTPTFELMLVAILVFGIVSGAVYTTLVGIVLDFVEEDKQNMALASRYVLYGFFCLIKSPLIGYTRVTLGSYNYLYYFMIICLIVSGFLAKLTEISAAFMKKRQMANDIS